MCEICYFIWKQKDKLGSHKQEQLKNGGCQVLRLLCQITMAKRDYWESNQNNAY